MDIVSIILAVLFCLAIVESATPAWGATTGWALGLAIGGITASGKYTLFIGLGAGVVLTALVLVIARRVAIRRVVESDDEG
ncbi:MAG: hypothetical protein CVU56_20270 [Deltaproteobacteria bacterium HGW-Deltaproteobacteria-14]|jgi:hypothetical protein|nr:MAG: hypothetical protein CVU56_20270 [Deltaproteobacteria bacterium HGW-Deltaproteobacteria-14]